MPTEALITLKAVCEDYLKREGPKLRSRDWYEATLKSALFYPRLGDKPIAEIKRSEIVQAPTRQDRRRQLAR